MSCKKCAENAEAVKKEERERILTLLGGFQNPAWRNHYLKAITELINK